RRDPPESSPDCPGRLPRLFRALYAPGLHRATAHGSAALPLPRIGVPSRRNGDQPAGRGTALAGTLHLPACLVRTRHDHRPATRPYLLAAVDVTPRGAEAPEDETRAHHRRDRLSPGRRFDEVECTISHLLRYP